jgi:hypothetical protein
VAAISQLCECNALCVLSARVDLEVCRRLQARDDLQLIVNGCPRGADPGSVLEEAGPGWKLYRTVTGGEAS